METLYKRSSSGAIQSWTIATRGNVIVTTYGLVGGKLQTTEDTIDEGKNAGRSNATTPTQQAEAEAKSKFEKQLKKGYVRTLAEAQAGKVDAVIEGGVVPMLAHKFSERGHKMKYPCYGQPKSDGMRCVAIVKNSKCTLWSRTRKPITSVPHVIAELERLFPKGEYVFDGELYNHELKEDFEQIISLARQETPKEGHEAVHYHVYDMVSPETFSIRSARLWSLLAGCQLPIVVVETFIIRNEDELTMEFNRMVEQGYEGLMVRSKDGVYVNKRSYDLLKVKSFLDEEFEIVSVEEGRGRLQGHAGAFVCKTKEGVEFRAKMRGSVERLKEYFENADQYVGKLLTVKFQGYTNAGGVPRFPVATSVRDYE